jgi:hypothetical protein
MAMRSQTNVTFLLDRSGSMEQIKRDTIGAFNAYLDGLDDADILFSLVQFDSQSLDKVCVRQPVKLAPRLTDANYTPRGSTPLIDAAYKTIKAVEASLNGDADSKVVICIQTDGEENSSTEHSWDDLNALIKEKTALGWQFNFMGASIDAYVQAQRMGVSAHATMSYDSFHPETTREAFAASAQNTSMFAKGLVASTDYSASQRAASGDVYAHKAHVSAPLPPMAVPQPTKSKTKAVDDFAL